MAECRKRLVISSIDLFALSHSSSTLSSWQQAGRLWAGFLKPLFIYSVPLKSDRASTLWGRVGELISTWKGRLCVAVCWRQAVGGQRTGGAWEQGCPASLRVWEGPPDSSSMEAPPWGGCSVSEALFASWPRSKHGSPTVHIHILTR